MLVIHFASTQGEGSYSSYAAETWSSTCQILKLAQLAVSSTLYRPPARYLHRKAHPPLASAPAHHVCCAVCRRARSNGHAHGSGGDVGSNKCGQEPQDAGTAGWVQADRRVRDEGKERRGQHLRGLGVRAGALWAVRLMWFTMKPVMLQVRHARQPAARVGIPLTATTEGPVL